ncbi:MAG TPA: MFS transporter [Vicinamibacterales bacterium]|nr:MFS transporter [Vicinamibacterales bacterium]
MQPAPAGPAGFGRLAAALAYRDFRILWLGALTSTSGTWMQKVAQGWLVFALTGSSFYLGLDDFLGQLPILLFTLLGGVVADRHDRRRLLLASQLVQMTAAFILAALVAAEVVRIWHVLALSFLTGLAQAFGGPAYQSLLPSLVDRRALPNAIALNSIQFNLARVVGPLLAGVAIAAWGVPAAFALNGLSFLVVVAAILSLKVAHVPPADRQSVLEELRGGLAYARSRPAILELTALAFVTTFLALPVLTLLPVFTADVFGGGMPLYSRLMTFSGLGAVAGALVVAWLGRFPRMGRTLLIVQAALGALITGFALSRSYWLSAPLLVATSAALIVVFSLTTSLVQLLAPDRLRGRVVSIYMVAFRGGMPLGSLAAGYAASLASAPLVLAVSGGMLAIVAVVFLAVGRAVRRA